MNEITIVGISGISGAGKSTLTKALANQLNASSLYWDDFDTVSQLPGDYVDWFKRGCNYTEFNYAALAQSLCELKSGKIITHPVTQENIAPTRYILVDAPLGRAHEQTACYIDTFIHIDTPLDIALARRLLRETKGKSNSDYLINSLNEYLSRSRPLFTTNVIKQSADYIIDGTQKIETQSKEALSFLKDMNSESNTINVEEADSNDIDKMNKLSHQKRMQYEKEQPIFWKWAGELGEVSQRNWFKELLSNDNYILLVAKVKNDLCGFVVGEIKQAPDVYKPGGLTMLVDDFCVVDNKWNVAGKHLLSALKEKSKVRGADQIIVVCGSHDKHKSDFLNKQKLNIVSNWYVSDI